MKAVDRRALLGLMLGGVAAASAATAGIALLSEPASAAALPKGLNSAVTKDSFVEDTVVIIHPRRSRRCWWHRGRRICSW